VLTAAARARHARRTELAGQLAATLDDAALAPHAELAVAYAPRLDPTSHRVFGVRAQPRWLVADDPDLVTELLAADAGLRDRLTAWALAQACRDSATWLAAGIALRIAVELPHSMVVRPEFADDLQRRLIETGCESLLFDLELVDVPVDDAELDRLASALRSLRVLGPRTALACVDDRRSLGELSGLPLDTLRLSGATLDRLGPTFVTAVTAIARGLGLRIALAEITNPDTLAGFDGCELHELAGPLLGAPVAAAQVPALLEPAGDSSDPARRARYDSLGPPSAEATFIVSDL
jgi:EAL domain-containing protein (putative c-di-GMP-specific phosphodiesterase class I)